jgi:hypothetical protein
MVHDPVSNYRSIPIFRPAFPGSGPTQIVPGLWMDPPGKFQPDFRMGKQVLSMTAFCGPAGNDFGQWGRVK